MANIAPKNNNKADRGKNKRGGNVVESSADNRKRLAKELKITDKTKEFYDELIDNPKIGIREAYKKHVRDSTSDLQASVNASRLKNSDKYAIYKASAVGKAKRRIVSLVDSSNESIALKASQDIVDRTEGKAVQKNESTVKTVEVRLDLTGLRSGSHYANPNNTPLITE